MKKAFTLIELLVVIAIIAILAAILFPVFAQAKAAAKDTAILSNAKQMGTSQLLYTTDNDDLFTPAVVVWDGSYTVWPVLLRAYMKNLDLQVSSKLPTPTTFLAFNSHYAMPLRGAANSTYVAPSSSTSLGSWTIGNTPRTATVTGGEVRAYDGIAGAAIQPAMAGAFLSYKDAPSLSTSAIGSPSEVVMITEGLQYDMGWGSTANMTNFAVGGFWVDPANNIDGAKIYYYGPHAKKNPKPMGSGIFPGTALPAATASPNGMPDGMSLAIATDSSAKYLNVRGQMLGGATVGDMKVVNRFWPGAR